MCAQGRCSRCHRNKWLEETTATTFIVIVIPPTGSGMAVDLSSARTVHLLCSLSASMWLSSPRCVECQRKGQAKVHRGTQRHLPVQNLRARVSAKVTSTPLARGRSPALAETAVETARPHKAVPTFAMGCFQNLGLILRRQVRPTIGQPFHFLQRKRKLWRE